MNTHDDPHDRPHDDDLIAAMRSLDPAADDEPPAALRDRVAAIPSVAPQASGSHGAPAPHAQRHRTRLVSIAAAAALMIGLGGGYLIGSRGGETSPHPQAGVPVAVATGSITNPAPPVSLGGTTAAGQAADAGLGSQAASGAELQLTAADVAVSPWHYSNGRRFAVPAFDQTASTATVYALDGRAQYSAADAERIAAALGVDGTAHQDHPESGWQVGDSDGGGPAFWLMPSGGGDVGYSSGIPDPYSECWTAVAPKYGLDTGGDVGEEAWRAFDAEQQKCVADTPMPTEQQARDALSLFLSATGVDESQTQVTVTPYEDGRTISATAARIIAANVTVVASSVTVSARGMLHGYGPTASIVSLGDYDIVSPAEAAGRLNDPVFAPAYASTMASEIDYEQFDDPVTEPPAVPVAGTRVPWGITEFEIASARLGLAQMTSIHDERFLAPAYEFTDTEGNVWSVLALTESEIDPIGGGASYGWWGPVY